MQTVWVSHNFPPFFRDHSYPSFPRYWCAPTINITCYPPPKESPWKLGGAPIRLARAVIVPLLDSHSEKITNWKPILQPRPPQLFLLLLGRPKSKIYFTLKSSHWDQIEVTSLEAIFSLSFFSSSILLSSLLRDSPQNTLRQWLAWMGIWVLQTLPENNVRQLLDLF